MNSGLFPRWVSKTICIAFGSLIASLPLAAQTLSGSLSNFDIFNDTGEVARGFEIQLEGLSRADVISTFGGTYNRYGDPQIVDYPGGVIVRYSSPYDAANSAFLTGTPVPAAMTATTGHQCYAGGLPGYPTSGCEHFGVGIARNPISTQYRWLLADPAAAGALRASASPVNVPPAFWTVTPGANGAAPVVAARIEAPRGNGSLKGDAFWVKVYVTQSTNSADLAHLLTDDPSVPHTAAETEAEWELFQFDPKKPDRSAIEHGKSLAQGTKSVVRRFEIYKYAGPYGAEHEAACADGKCKAPAAGEVGDYVGAQMSAAQFGILNPVPGMSITGVSNSATGLPSIESGSWVSIYGKGLSTSSREWRDTDFQGGHLPINLEDVRVTINGKPAPVAYISPTQVNVQAPADTASGLVQVQVTNAGGTASSTASLQPYAPGFFSFQGKYAAAVHVDGSFVAPAGFFGPGVATRPAKPGETIVVYGTGFGPTSPGVAAGVLVGAAAPLADISQLRVRIAGIPAAVQFAGLVAVGEYQLNVVVPALPNGDYPVVADIAGVSTQTGLTITVQN